MWLYQLKILIIEETECGEDGNSLYYCHNFFWNLKILQFSKFIFKNIHHHPKVMVMKLSQLPEVPEWLKPQTNNPFLFKSFSDEIEWSKPKKSQSLRQF